MMELLHFIFTDIAHFIGALMLIFTIGLSVHVALLPFAAKSISISGGSEK